MKYDPYRHHRKSIRLPGYDYGQAGLYFITICTKNRQNFFGEIKNQKLHLNSVGNIVFHEWYKTAEIRHNIILDAFQIMPNHIHGIIIISKNNENSSFSSTKLNRKFSHKFGPQHNNLFTIIGGFKSAVKVKANKNQNEIFFEWQSRFFDRIIRNKDELYRIRNYILDNPKNWKKDQNNPDCANHSDEYSIY